MDVLIIGAGISSLTAARTLLTHPPSIIGSVTIVEALGYVGGRIRSCDDFVPGGHRIDLGAEYIHGFDTMLTRVVDQNKDKWEKEMLSQGEELLEDIFIVAHADGGPQNETTKDGKYGVYYLAKENKLLRFDTDDEDFCYLTEALSSLEYREDDDNYRMQSLGSYLDEHLNIPKRMLGIMDAGFGNTAGCSDLYKISLSAIADFEAHWEDNEVEGDARLNSKIGMIGVVEALLFDLQHEPRFALHLNWSAKIITWDGTNRVISSDGQDILADKIIITVPPPIITSHKIDFQPPLPKWKIDAFSMVGMERAIKIIVKFKNRVWPKDVQNVIAADLYIPEIWFREITDNVHLAVGFLTSKSANNLKDLMEEKPLTNKIEFAAAIMKEELATIFGMDRQIIDDCYVSSVMLDWGEIDSIQGGYIYPKVGIVKNDFHLMAKRIGDLFWAGEATNDKACCTIQSAMETGARVANEIVEYLTCPVVL